MLRASPGRPVRIVTSSIALHCARFGVPWGGALLRLRNDVTAARTAVAFPAARRYFAGMNPIRVLAAGALTLLLVLPSAEAARSKKKAASPAPAEPAAPKSTGG